MRPRIRALACVLAAGAALAVPGPASAETGRARQDAVLRSYAADTWRSLTAMVDPGTGVPSDGVSGDLATRDRVTSPTNIGGYLWSTVAARDLGLISASDARGRVLRALASVERLARHPGSGQFFNWYDPATLRQVTTWPGNGNAVKQFLSSVDNAWLAGALMTVRNAVPASATAANRILRGMDFAAYYDPKGATNGTGLLRGGFWVAPPDPDCSIKGNYTGGPDVYYTCHVYGAPGETRMASYVGIALGQVPPRHYFGLMRTMGHSGCDYGWQETKPEGTTQRFMGLDVFQGTYGYRGIRLVPTWGGSMFEALMPDLLVPESAWAPRSWGRNHHAFVDAQVDHGLNEARYGYWGFSPSNDPAGGYREYGVDGIGIQQEGYTSDQERTQTDPGYEGCRPAASPPTSFGDGVVTPHASFLALPYARHTAMTNLAKLKSRLGAYGPGGFYDAVAVRSGTVSRRYLSLDQSMVMGALGNVLARGTLQRNFGTADVERRLRPLLGQEAWNVVVPPGKRRR
ncbi:glucoamylase family protein [Spirillospora sp. CA-294931]|uniref:glucoamylase family protein n=1 Tax=Spirillospora sp. CA-294931 TaxID=3240042 RepID=UPI003D904855